MFVLIEHLLKILKPNIKLLNNAIYQTEKKKLNITESNYIDFIIEQIEKRDFKLIQNALQKYNISNKQPKKNETFHLNNQYEQHTINIRTT